MPDGHDATIEVSNIMSFVLYTQILKQSVLKPTSPGITLNYYPQEVKRIWKNVARGRRPSIDSKDKSLTVPSVA